MKNRRTPLAIAFLAAACLLLAPTLLGAQEPPEHPEETEHPEEAEHPEHPEEEAEHPEGHEHEKLTADQLADAIAAWVDERSGDDGTMTVEDPETGEELHLTLDKVHRERLSRVGPDTYFACADFETPDGTIVDLDVFMKGTQPGNLTFHDLSVHKVDGEPRYTWHEKDGEWHKKPVGEEAGEEHPEGDDEHPEEHEGSEGGGR